MRVQGRAIIQNFKYCNKCCKLKVGYNVTHGDREYCDKNEGDAENRVLCATLAVFSFCEFLVTRNKQRFGYLIKQLIKLLY